ncbi:MAG: hypothetical protein BWY31_02793 [Lentisphaerae bacterium ADurb.Bin242]|nr:MAG: hypothetical protein BWY31_02793 [Lentisphaerae bacterium ADurb.Bin242]
MDMSKFTQRGVDNAEFLFVDIAKAKEGESVCLVTDDAGASAASLLGLCARRMGLKPFIIDLSLYGAPTGGPPYAGIPAIKAAVLASDITFSLGFWYSWLLKDTKLSDEAHSGVQRRFFLGCANSITEWEYNRAEILKSRERTPLLNALIRHSKELRITTEAGTDLVCEIGDENIHMISDVLYLVPFYSEVAVIPKRGTVNGTAVVDGHIYYVRRDEFGFRELDTEPVRLKISGNKVMDYSAPPGQLERLEKFINTADPRADQVDEIGFVTMTDHAFSKYHWGVWGGAGHAVDSIHIALGNDTGGRVRPDTIHAAAHSDFDIMHPTLSLDGHVIFQNGKYDDNYIFGALA